MICRSNHRAPVLLSSVKDGDQRGRVGKVCCSVTEKYRNDIESVQLPRRFCSAKGISSAEVADRHFWTISKTARRAEISGPGKE